MYKVDDNYELAIAQPEELEILTELCMEATSVSPYAAFSRTQYEVQRLLDTWMNDPKFVCLVLLYQQKPVGILVGFMTHDHPSLNMFVGMELVWYVKPEHRKVRASFAMLEAFEYWTKKNGGSASIMGDYERKLEKLYNRKGYRTLETTYIKELVVE